jgi:hypothetical protein
VIDFRDSHHMLAVIVVDKFNAWHTLDFLVEGLDIDFIETTNIAQENSVTATVVAVQQVP